MTTLHSHSVVTSAYLKNMQISPQHVQKYLKSGWIEALGSGAFKRTGEAPTWAGALKSVQSQLALPIHVGAMTALATQGASHYVRIGRERVFLFSMPGVNLPTWFKNHAWGATVDFIRTQFLPDDLGVREQSFEGFRLKAAAPERAILECLHLAPDSIDLMECYQVVEGLQNLRPPLMQQLLESCNSFKVKRLFLFMAEKAGLPVMNRLEIDRISLGSGSRALVPGGKYDRSQDDSSQGVPPSPP